MLKNYKILVYNMNDIKNDIKQKIIKNILDNSYKNNNIIISFSLLNDKYFVLHIYNPNNEEIKINPNNELFFQKITNMLFNKSESQKGCFNHQQSKESHLYNSALDVVLNYFLKIEYSFILVEINTFLPLSLSCLVNNYIYNVCTNFENRGQGNMEQLLNHIFILIKENKLKNGNYKDILLDVVYENPDYKSVKKYYEDKFDFNFYEEMPNKTVLKKII